jgi:GxxExxY protein
METDNYKHSQLTDKIIKVFFTVYNKLGYGFLEKVYENAMLIELRKAGLLAEPQVPIKVYYEQQEIGDYYADIIVNGLVILELKATQTIAAAHEAQLVNYLKATQIEVGLLLNFGLKPEMKRKVFLNEQK